MEIWKSRRRIPPTGSYPKTSKTVSRVLYLTVIYLDALLPVRSSHPGSGRASLNASIPVLLRIEFTASPCLHGTGELLPRLSILTPRTQNLRVPLKGNGGGISLLHFSSDRSGRALPVILALWSPDFPHGRPFGLPTRLSVLLVCSILQELSQNVNGEAAGCRSRAVRRFLRKTSPFQTLKDCIFKADAVYFIKFSQSFVRRGFSWNLRSICSLCRRKLLP